MSSVQSACSSKKHIYHLKVKRRKQKYHKNCIYHHHCVYFCCHAFFRLEHDFDIKSIRRQNSADYLHAREKVASCDFLYNDMMPGVSSLSVNDHKYLGRQVRAEW